MDTTGWRVKVLRNNRLGLRQRFHVRIEAANGESLFTSETYRSESDAAALAAAVASGFGLSFVSLDYDPKR